MLNDINEFLTLRLLTIGGTAVEVWQIIAVPLLLGLAWYAFRLLDHVVARRLAARDTDANLTQLIRRVLLIVFVALVAATLLQLLNVPLAAFAFISGAIAIGFGFGAQNIINNFISGWILMWERPIRIGDFIELGEARGTVQSINTRSTQIRRVDGVHLLVPNSQLLENTVVNWTLVDRLARSIVRVGVAYGSPVRKVHELLMLAAAECEDILDDPQPLVLFEDFGDSSLVFDTVFWAEALGEKDLRVIRSDLRFRIDALFAEHGIVIAFPQRDVHLLTGAPLAVRIHSEDAADA
ncbi:MAG: mechanosensitive ion channel domain-containing protein [Gammaproteobacteria bacterium]|jgi:small-conductance mechanosensitive channel|nr:mechanosensitive ion channel domain-containing protein [Gammaproteobacteria bacterium]